MPIIKTTLTAPAGLPAPLTKAEADARRAAIVKAKIADLHNAPAEQYDAEYAEWSRLMKVIWNDPHPEVILAGLGVNAVGYFQMSAAKADHLKQIATIACDAAEAARRHAAIDAIEAKVKPYTPHPDGTVTLIPPPAPAPDPTPAPAPAPAP